MENTIITYGGGEILRDIFNSIAMIFGKGSIMQPLTVIALSIAGFWAVSKAFFSSSPHQLIKTFILPVIVLPGLFLMPNSEVSIEDTLTQKSYKVDHVPLVLAVVASISSSLGYRINQALEDIMHTTNDKQYLSSGMIFGGEASLDIRRYKISNGDLEKNLRNFSKQCILYDLALDLYTIDDLKKSTDLWTFLSSKTSKVRMVPYKIPNDRIDGNKSKIIYLSCKKAMEEMTPIFQAEKKYQGQLDLVKNLPLTFQALTGLQKDQGNLVSQQLMMNLLAGEFSAKEFGKSRAQAQQYNTSIISGALASKYLLNTRAVFAILLYASFIFVVPLSLLSGGIKTFTTWIWYNVWIQIWPPFYTILGYIAQLAAQSEASGILKGSEGLSLFTSVGLRDIHEGIYATACYLSLSIPFLSYAILKGGMESFVHLAGSMLGPTQSAVSNAATEMTTGNYSFGNISQGQMSYQNISGFQNNTAASLSSGYMTENNGMQSTVHTLSGAVLDQKNSNLRESIFSDKAITEGLQTAYQTSQSAHESAQKTYNESISGHTRSMSDLTEHLSHAENYNENISSRASMDMHESAKYLMSEAETWGTQFGLSQRQSLEILAGVSSGALNWLGIDFKANTHHGTTSDEVLSSAQNLASSTDFQKNFQKVQDFSQGEAYSCLNDEGVRLATAYTRSLDEVHSSQTQQQAAFTNMNQISENLSWAENNSISLKNSLNQEFINWASNKYSSEGGFSYVSDILNSPDKKYERACLASEFTDIVRQEYSHLGSTEITTPQDFHDNAASNIKSVNVEQEFINIRSFAEQDANHFNIQSGTVKALSSHLNGHHIKNDVHSNLHGAEDKINNNSLSNEFEIQSDKILAERFVEGLQPKIQHGMNAIANATKPFVISAFHMTQKPFWFKEENK